MHILILKQATTLGTFTTGNPLIAVCLKVCRVLKHGHTPDLCRVPVETAHGKRLAHGKPFICRVSGENTHGKGPTHGKGVHLPCAAYGSTRQRFSTRQRVLLCCVPAILHTAKSWHTTNLCQQILIQHSQFFLIYI